MKTFSWGEEQFIKRHMEKGFDVLWEAAGADDPDVAFVETTDAVGIDTALRRLLDRHPNYSNTDAAAFAGTRVSRIIWKSVMQNTNTQALQIWSPALWTFQALFSRLFLLEVQVGALTIRENEDHLLYITEEGFRLLPREFVEHVLVLHEKALVCPIAVVPDADTSRRYGHRGTMH